jgi:predicted RNA-binding protein YlxR (DUF448 family)
VTAIARATGETPVSIRGSLLLTVRSRRAANGERRVELSAKRRKHVPQRSCIACRAKLPKRELIRVVRTPEGMLEIDLKGKRAGRGAYLCRKWQCSETALQPGRLSQALKCKVGAAEVSALKASVSSLIEGTENESQTAPQGGANT